LPVGLDSIDKRLGHKLRFEEVVDGY
jgi:hypothetical protein